MAISFLFTLVLMFMINLFVSKETRFTAVVGTNLGMLVSAFMDLEQGKNL